jgi:hypothetical protein
VIGEPFRCVLKASGDRLQGREMRHCVPRAVLVPELSGRSGRDARCGASPKRQS